MGEVSFHLIGTNGFHIEAEKENFLLWAHVVVRASSFKLSSFGGLRQKLALKLRGVPHVQHDYFSSFDQ